MSYWHACASMKYCGVPMCKNKSNLQKFPAVQYYIPDSGKFSRGPSFVVFTDDYPTVKIEPAK